MSSASCTQMVPGVLEWEEVAKAEEERQCEHWRNYTRNKSKSTPGSGYWHFWPKVEQARTRWSLLDMHINFDLHWHEERLLTRLRNNFSEAMGCSYMDEFNLDFLKYWRVNQPYTWEQTRYSLPDGFPACLLQRTNYSTISQYSMIITTQPQSQANSCNDWIKYTSSIPSLYWFLFQPNAHKLESIHEIEHLN